MSCNDLCLTSDYDGSTEFYSEATRRAAKEHRCEECSRVIAKGESYQNASGKTDGDFWSTHTCLVCVEIRQAFSCGGWMIGTLWEDIREQMFPRWDEVTAIDCLARLTTDAAIAKIRAEYAKYMEDRS